MVYLDFKLQVFFSCASGRKSCLTLSGISFPVSSASGCAEGTLSILFLDFLNLIFLSFDGVHFCLHSSSRWNTLGVGVDSVCSWEKLDSVSMLYHLPRIFLHFCFMGYNWHVTLLYKLNMYSIITLFTYIAKWLP